LLVWSEDVYDAPRVLLHGAPSPAPTAAEDTSDRHHLEQLARRVSAALLLGVCRMEPGTDLEQYASLLYFSPGAGYAGCYDKTRLSPVLEFQPRVGRLLSAVLGRPILHPSTFGCARLEFGRRAPVFRLAEGSPRGPWTFAGSICYDAWFPEIPRLYLASGRGRPAPDFFVNVANETMTRASGSSVYARDALANVRFRAVECRRAFVRCCGDGPSAVIDSCGRVIDAEVGPDEAKRLLIAGVPLDGRRSPYADLGDLFPAALIAATGLVLVGSLARAHGAGAAVCLGPRRSNTIAMNDSAAQAREA
jgi:apolipoprotein N-acyltransferase